GVGDGPRRSPAGQTGVVRPRAPTRRRLVHRHVRLPGSCAPRKVAGGGRRLVHFFRKRTAAGIVHGQAAPLRLGVGGAAAGARLLPRGRAAPAGSGGPDRPGGRVRRGPRGAVSRGRRGGGGRLGGLP